MPPREAQHAEVLARREPCAPPRKRGVPRIADHVDEMRLRQQRGDFAHHEDVVGRLLAGARLPLALRVHPVELARAGVGGERRQRGDACRERGAIETEIRPVRHRRPVGGHDVDEAPPLRLRVARERHHVLEERGLRRKRDLRMAVQHHGEQRRAGARTADDDRKRRRSAVRAGRRPRCRRRHRGGGRHHQTSSTAIAVASPPPMHSAATPRFLPCLRSAPISVTTMRAPDAPIGWPSAQAPPWTLTISWAMP